jgi:hypothetical protein
MTATRIIWSEDMALTVARQLQDVQESFYEALEHGGWVVIHADDGQKVSVNPAQVRYLEEVAPPPTSNGAGRRAGRPRRQQAAATS